MFRQGQLEFFSNPNHSTMTADKQHGDCRITRRCFIRASTGGVLLWVAGGKSLGCASSFEPWWPIIVADPALCGACSRCAITCAALSDDLIGPARGLISPDRVYQDQQFDNPYWHPTTCHMCPRITSNDQLVSPACVAACPTKAAQIALSGHHVYGSNPVRYIDASHCVGCGSCVKVCPYHHPLLYGGKAHKCDLCIGRWTYPPCVEECPASALIYYQHYETDPPRPFPWETES